jgi:hypothetical protein
MFERYVSQHPGHTGITDIFKLRIVRPNPDSQVHQLEVAAVTKVHLDAAVSAADLEVAWLLVVAEVVKSMFLTFVTSLLPLSDLC